MDFAGKCSTRDMLIRDVKRSGRLFPESGCILEHQIVRFAKVILRDRCSTLYDLASPPTTTTTTTTTTATTLLRTHTALDWLHYTRVHNTTVHYIHYTTLHDTTLQLQLQLHSFHYTTPTARLQLQLQLHYTTLHPAVVGEVATATIATTPKNTTPTTFRSISGFALPSVIHNNQPLL